MLCLVKFADFLPRSNKFLVVFRQFSQIQNIYKRLLSNMVGHHILVAFEHNFKNSIFPLRPVGEYTLSLFLMEADWNSVWNRIWSIFKIKCQDL